MNATKEIKRPVIRYHGGKWRIAGWIISNFPEHRIYTEPFGGAASVLLQKPRSYAEVYNDLDGEMVNLFRVMREHGDELRETLRCTPFAREEFDLSYEPTDDPLEQARRTVVRNYMGFGSTAQNSRHKTGFRANSNRSGTTPAHDWVNYSDGLEAIIDRLQGVVIENRHGIDVMLQHDTPETLHYVDPPYVWATRTGRPGADKRSYRHEMTDDDHRELAEAIRSLEGMVIISGYPSELYEGLFPDWKVITRHAVADRGRKSVECLWVSPNTPPVCPELELELSAVPTGRLYGTHPRDVESERGDRLYDTKGNVCE